MLIAKASPPTRLSYFYRPSRFADNRQNSAGRFTAQRSSPTSTGMAPWASVAPLRGATGRPTPTTGVEAHEALHPTVAEFTRSANRQAGGRASVPHMRHLGHRQSPPQRKPGAAMGIRPTANRDAARALRCRQRWTISAIVAALGLTLAILTGATSAVSAWAAVPDTVSTHAIHQNSDAAVLPRAAQLAEGHAALMPALLLLLIPRRRGCACRNRRLELAGRLHEVPASGRGPPAAAAPYPL